MGDAGVAPPEEVVEHKGWYRPRGLPHFDSPDVVQAVTFRLADSLPKNFDRGRLAGPPDTKLRRIADMLDKGAGSCILRDQANATTVEDALLHGHGHDYTLHAWVIMPNHVHAIVEPLRLRLPLIVQQWKSISARAINALRGTSGSVWQRDYFDRFMRSGEQYLNAVAYVEENPVKAGLVAAASEWRFSSAWRGHLEGARPRAPSGG